MVRVVWREVTEDIMVVCRDLTIVVVFGEARVEPEHTWSLKWALW